MGWPAACFCTPFSCRPLACALAAPVRMWKPRHWPGSAQLEWFQSSLDSGALLLLILCLQKLQSPSVGKECPLHRSLDDRRARKPEAFSTQQPGYSWEEEPGPKTAKPQLIPWGLSIPGGQMCGGMDPAGRGAQACSVTVFLHAPPPFMKEMELLVLQHPAEHFRPTAGAYLSCP